VSPRRWPQLVDAATGRVLIERLELAATFWQRFRGWQFRALPPRGSGVLLAPCNSIHTAGMRFAIDAVFIGQDGTVLQIASDLLPWRAVRLVRGAQAVLEVPSGRCQFQPGQRLAIACAADCQLPPPLRFLQC